MGLARYSSIFARYSSQDATPISVFEVAVEFVELDVFDVFAGAAFVYVLTGSTWTQQAILLANDGTSNDEFGYSVAINEDTIVVGSFHDDVAFSNSGSAYVFVRNGTIWTQQQKLTASDGTADDEFGNSVGIFLNDIIVGAHHADLPSNAEAGAGYRFIRSGGIWSQSQRLNPVAPVPLGDHFGSSVAMDDHKAAIGAAGDGTLRDWRRPLRTI